MPHRTQMQVIKRRLVGKEGADRIRELRTILAELPGYRSGPYADIRKWVVAEIERSQTKKRVVHRDSIAVRREGAAQIALARSPQRREVVSAAGAVERADQDRGLRVHDDPAGACRDAHRRRPRPARRDSGSARGGYRGSGRRARTAWRPSRRRRDRPLPRRLRRPAGPARSSGGTGARRHLATVPRCGDKDGRGDRPCARAADARVRGARGRAGVHPRRHNARCAPRGDMATDRSRSCVPAGGRRRRSRRAAPTRLRRRRRAHDPPRA